VCARAKIQEVLRGPVVSWGWSWDGDDALTGPVRLAGHG
jgi:hypothetical protein